MGGGASAPAPSREERQLQEANKEMIDLQRHILERQQEQNKVLLPFFAEQQGYNVTMSKGGRITSISERFDPDKEVKKQIERELDQRSLKALRGELPLDPGMERDLASQRKELENRLSSQFGPGFSTASPAQEALQRYDESANILREGARTGQLTLAEQLGITRQQQREFTQSSGQDATRQWAVGDQLTLAGAFGQTANNYLRAQQPYIQNRQMQLQASIANAQSRTSLMGAGIGAIGSLFSDADIKDDFVQIGKHRTGIPIYVYTRKDTGERMIGVLAQDVQKVAPHAVGERSGYLTVDYEELERSAA